MSYDALCFDLDGTLWDATDAAVAALNLVAVKHHLRDEPITRSQVEATTGMPLDACIESYFGQCTEELISEIEVQEARLVAEVGHTLYQGLESTLTRLGHHYPLYLISNCGTAYLQAFFNETGLATLFDAWDCYGESRVPKATMISNLISAKSINSLLYVGDTHGDYQAATEAGVGFCFANYGFGDAPGASLRIERISDLVEHLLG